MYDRPRALQALQAWLTIVFFTVGLGLLISLAIHYYRDAPPSPETVSTATIKPQLEGSPSVREVASRPEDPEEEPSPLGPFLPPEMKEEVRREYLRERVQETVAAERGRPRATALVAEETMVSPPPPVIQPDGAGSVSAPPEAWFIPPAPPAVAASSESAKALSPRPVRLSLPRSLFGTDEQAAEAASLLGTQLAEQGCWATIIVTAPEGPPSPDQAACSKPTPVREERTPAPPPEGEPRRIAQASAPAGYPPPPPRLAQDVGRDSVAARTDQRVPATASAPQSAPAEAQASGDRPKSEVAQKQGPPSKAKALSTQPAEPFGPQAPPRLPERRAHTLKDVYLVQGGTLNTAAAARNKQAQLRKEGFAVQIRDLGLAGPPRYVLWAGPFDNRIEAEALRQALAAAGQEAQLIPTVRFVQEADASGEYAVQVGSFARAIYADRLRQALEQEKLPAFIEPVETSAGRLYRVLVGPVRNEQEARRAALGLDRRGYQTMVRSLAQA